MRALAAVLAVVAVALLLWWPRPVAPGPAPGAANAPSEREPGERARDGARRDEAPAARADGGGGAPAADGLLAGSVVDRLGNGIAGAEVIAVPAPPAASVTATTAADGTFTLRGTPRAALRVLVRHHDFVAGNAAVAGPSPAPLRIVLGRRPLVRGKVVAAGSGAPMARFAAALLAIDAGAAADALPAPGEPPPDAQSFERADGTFELSAEDAGPHALLVFPARGIAAQLRLELAADAVAEPTVRITAGVRARGVVRDADGQLVASARVVLSARSADATAGAVIAGAVATTAADGAFALREVAAGDHAFAVFPVDGPALVEQPVRFDLAAPEPFVTLQLPAGAAATGTVQPWRSGQSAEVVFAHERGPVRRASVDVATGAFALADLTPGAYRVFVERTEPTWRSRVAHQLRDAIDTARIELPPGGSGRVDPQDPVAAMARVRGRITGHGAPDRLVVRAFREDAPLPDRVTGLFRAALQRDGAFELDGLLAGRWRLQAMAGDDVLAWDVVDLARGADVEFVLRVGDGR